MRTNGECLTFFWHFGTRGPRPPVLFPVVKFSYSCCPAITTNYYYRSLCPKCSLPTNLEIVDQIRTLYTRVMVDADTRTNVLIASRTVMRTESQGVPAFPSDPTIC